MNKTVAFCVEFSKCGHLAINESIFNIRKLFVQKQLSHMEITDWTQGCMVENRTYCLPTGSKAHVFESHLVWSYVGMCAACIGRILQQASPLPTQSFIHLQTTCRNPESKRQ